MKKKVIGLLFVMTTAALARDLTLESAIDLGLANGKSIKSSEISQKNADLTVKKAFKEALPKLSYTGQYDTMEITKKAMTDGYHKSGYTHSLAIYQPLFMGGAIKAGILSSKVSKDIAMLNYLAQKRDVRMDIIKLYADIKTYERNLDVLNNSMEELQQRYKKQKEQLELRLIVKADLLKTEYDILNLESEMTGMKTNLNIAKKDLKLKLMIPEDEPLNLADIKVPDNLVSDIDFEKDLNQALTNSLSARLAKDKEEIARIETKSSKAALMPKVNAFAGYGTSGESHKLKNSMKDTEWRGGVTVDWDIFQFGKNRDEYEIAKNNEEIERLNRAQTDDNIRLEVTSDYRELLRLHQLKNSKAKAVEAAKSNLYIDRERYNEGLITIVDYLLSQTQYREAAVNYNKALLDYYVAFEKYRSALI